MVDPNKILDTRPERWKGFIGNDPRDRWTKPRDKEWQRPAKLLDDPEREEEESEYE